MRQPSLPSLAKSPSLCHPARFYRALATGGTRSNCCTTGFGSAEAYTPGPRPAPVSYLSAEYLPRPHLENNLVNLGLREAAAAGPASETGLTCRRSDQRKEPENRGLGQTAVWVGPGGLLPGINGPAFELPAISAYGIPLRVRHLPPADSLRQSGGGAPTPGGPGQPLGSWCARSGRHPVHRSATNTVIGVRLRQRRSLGYMESATANTLRLLVRPRAPERFDFGSFNAGGTTPGGSAEDAVGKRSRRCSNSHDEDGSRANKLRLSQQIFFVSCSLRTWFPHPQGQGLAVTDFHTQIRRRSAQRHPPAIAVAKAGFSAADG